MTLSTPLILHPLSRSTLGIFLVKVVHILLLPDSSLLRFTAIVVVLVEVVSSPAPAGLALVGGITSTYDYLAWKPSLGWSSPIGEGGTLSSYSSGRS